MRRGQTGVELESSYLVQRLQRPSKGFGPLGVDNPFAFGGGRRNGGLSSDAMDLLRPIWSFDYMGAAEFEFGAVPEALSVIANSEEKTAFSFTVPLAEVPANWREPKDAATPDGDATIYFLAPAEIAKAVRGRIEEWARGKHPPRPRLKEALRFTEALRPVEEWDTETCGWLELNNGFLFFTDREMWEKTCALFGVEPVETS